MQVKKSYAIFVHCYPPARGGIETLTADIVRGLISTDDSVDVFTGKGQTLDSYKNFSNWVDISDDPPYVHRLLLRNNLQRFANRYLYPAIPTWSRFAPWYFGPILHYGRDVSDIVHKSDIIIGMAMPTKSFVDAAHYAQKYHKPLILIPAFHDVSYYKNCPAFQKAFDAADMVLCLSDHERELLTQYYTIQPHKLDILPYAPYTQEQLNTSRAQSRATAERKAARIRMSQSITFGYIGQVTTRKDLIKIGTLLDLCEHNGITARVTIAGARTNESQTVESQLAPWIEKKKIEIRYNFRTEEKNALYEKIDLFVNPSEEESLGVVNFEAIMSGTILMHRSDSPFATLLLSKSVCLDDNMRVLPFLRSLLQKDTAYVTVYDQQLAAIEKRSLDRATQMIQEAAKELNLR